MDTFRNWTVNTKQLLSSLNIFLLCSDFLSKILKICEQHHGKVLRMTGNSFVNDWKRIQIYQVWLRYGTNSESANCKIWIVSYGWFSFFLSLLDVSNIFMINSGGKYQVLILVVQSSIKQTVGKLSEASFNRKYFFISVGVFLASFPLMLMDFLNDHVGVWSNNNNYETTPICRARQSPAEYTILLYSSP